MKTKENLLWDHHALSSVQDWITSQGNSGKKWPRDFVLVCWVTNHTISLKKNLFLHDKFINNFLVLIHEFS